MMVTIVRWVFGSIGVAALYLSFCLKETQEGIIQDRIDEFWKGVDARQKQTGTRVAALFNRVAGVVSGTFDRLFGPKSFSIQVIGVSISLSFATLFLFGGLVFGYFLYRLSILPVWPRNLSATLPHSLSFLTTFCLSVGVVFFVLGTLPSILKWRVVRILSLLPAFLFFYAVADLAQRHILSQLQFSLALAVILSVMSDILLLVGVRASIRWISKELNPLRLVAATLVQVALPFLIVWLPQNISGRLLVKHEWPIASSCLLTTALFNIFTSLAAWMFSIALLAVLVQRLLWPAIEKIIYPFSRYKIARNHAAMATFGAGCIASAFPSAAVIAGSLLAWLLAMFAGQRAPQ